MAALVPPGVYFIVRNKCKSRMLAMDDNGVPTTTTNRCAKGWEGFRIEETKKKGVYFLTSHKFNGAKTFAIDDNGVVTSTIHRDPNGWEGIRIKTTSEDGVFYLVRNKDKTLKLACDDHGKLQCNTNGDPNGHEGWRLEFVSHYN